MDLRKGNVMRLRKTFVVVSAGMLALSGCSSDAAGEEAGATCVTVTDAWVKAVDSGMTGAFGTLGNSTDADLDVTSASSPASARMELHEVADENGTMVMRPVEGGFVVPAGGDLTLQPGGYHLMLMDVTEPIEPGDDVSFTVTCANGATTDFTAQAKEFTGAEEEYDSGEMDGMESSSPSM